MKRLVLSGLLGILLALVPLVAHAQDEDEGFILRIDGDIRIARDEVVGGVVVISGNAVIEGKVENTLLVIDGTATVSGQVEDDIIVIDGDLDLRDGATVNDVRLIRSDLQRSSGATITGDVEERDNFFVIRGVGFLFSVVLWLAVTTAVIVAGLLFAAIGGRQLKAASLALTQEVGNSILGAVIVWVGVPIVAVIVMITVIGIPLGIGLLLFVLPVLWLLGYIAAGTRLGMLITGYARRDAGDHPYLAAGLGLLTLQIVAILPFLGWLIALFAGLWGAGGIALVAFRAARGGPPAPAAPAAVEQPVA